MPPKRVYQYDHKTKKVVRVDNRVHHSNYSGPMVNNAYAKRPVRSVGVGVHPDQVAEHRETLKGIQGASVLPNGEVEFTSRRGRRDALKRLGFIDRDGGYGD